MIRGPNDEDSADGCRRQRPGSFPAKPRIEVCPRRSVANMTQLCRPPPTSWESGEAVKFPRIEASVHPHVVGEALLSSAVLWTIVRPPLHCGCEHHGQSKCDS